MEEGGMDGQPARNDEMAVPSSFASV
jgi:hypothetical protein